MKIFSGSANEPLAYRIAQKLGLELSPIETHIFPDGEKRIRIIDEVVGQECIVVQPTSMPVDTNYMELFFIVDGLKRSGASAITVVMPYVGYQRQDHIFRSGEAVTLEVVIKTLERVGVARIVVFDLHSIKIQELFSIPVTHLSGLELFADIIKKEQWNTSESFLVSPDMGGIRRIKILSELLDDMPYVSIEKNRDLVSGDVKANIIHGIETQKGKKRALIVDDMISSGNTIAIGSKLLVQHGVEEIMVFATHGVFSEHAPIVLERSLAQKVYVTDTIVVPIQKQFPKLEIISIAGIIAKQL